MNEDIQLVAENRQSTVVALYERDADLRPSDYESEAELENALLAQLGRQGYEVLDINSEAELIANLRTQIEKLNRVTFSDGEWQRFFKTEIAAEGYGVKEKTNTIQRDAVKSFVFDDGTKGNIKLIERDENRMHANSTQVLHQYVPTGGKRENRYDVTILVNGLPLVHIELKRRGVNIREAFNQIERYGRESFWAGNGLFEYVQLFVISNGTLTKYYSNTTRQQHLREKGNTTGTAQPKTSNSFEFTNYWADRENNLILDLTDFTATFFTRHTLLAMLTRYCVLTEQDLLLAMRPYQVAATEELLLQIDIAHNGKLYGKKEGGGYVWHTTGSGKTLTSFKAAQLATKKPFVKKVMFVVDRKDLDYQTIREYDRFEKGAANGNTSTRILERNMGDDNKKILVTTIQKLSSFIKKVPDHKIYNEEVVIVFDECHRSQFGDMHRDIRRKFKRYYMFGFTGTPIFAENMVGAKGLENTTDDIFGRRLHTYNIVDAIRDQNVLRFRIDYISTMKEKEDMENALVWDIEREAILMDERRIHNVAQYILDNFDRHTKRSKHYSFSAIDNIEQLAKAKNPNTVEEQRRKTRLAGFNSIFAVQSIPMLKLYYLELKRLMEELPQNKRLKIATIFSYAANEEVNGDDGEEDNDSTEGLDQSSRDFLDMCIDDYNKMFGTSYDTSSEKFPNYYKDVSMRMKNREIDMLLVVNMFLTGFDATTLNTLWVDKNLRYHGLLQAFSRTNRILNSIKAYGNIVCFRNLETPTNKALALFGDKQARGVSILRRFADYFNGYTDDTGKYHHGYVEYVQMLRDLAKPGEMPLTDEEKREFVTLFSQVLRMNNLLNNFDQFAGVNTLSLRDMQDYTSVYLEIKKNFPPTGTKGDSDNVNDDIVFEMELVKQQEVSIDFILYLVRKYQESHKQDLEIKAEIRRSIESSPELRDKRELIERFIDSLDAAADVDTEWQQYINREKNIELQQIIEREHLKQQPTLDFMSNAFKMGYVPEGGTGYDNILPAINPFDRSANRSGVLARVKESLKQFFTKFFGIGNSEFNKIEINHVTINVSGNEHVNINPNLHTINNHHDERRKERKGTGGQRLH